MRTRIDHKLAAFILCFPLFSGVARGELPSEAGHASDALRSYVSKPDDSFDWKVRHSGKLLTSEYRELKLVSQTWHGRPWKHQLFILKPSSADMETKQALLLIAGGRWRAEMDDDGFRQKLPNEAVLIATIAEQLGTPIAVLLHVPHQPLFDGMVEDEIISYTFDRFIDTGDDRWPLLLPMVKSAVRAMDVVQEQCRKNWQIEIESFTVTGASKRGWTTWLTGAIDARASAIAPMVIDVVNMGRQLEHQHAVWGALSEQINDYTQRGLPEKLSTPRGKQLLSIVDPYSYRHHLQQPKLLILGTNDRYWPLDSLNLYWNDLQGEKHILYVPNNRHSIHDFARLTATLGEFHRRAAHQRTLPQLSWEFTLADKELKLVVRPHEDVSEVRVWTASSMTRDFRDARWTSQPADGQGKRFQGKLTLPSQGHAAIFAESVYDGNGAPFYLSTNVRIVDGHGVVSD